MCKLTIESNLYISNPRLFETYGIKVGAFSIIEGSKDNPTDIGQNSSIGHHVVISEGVSLSDNVVLDAQSYIGKNTTIGFGSEIHGVKVHRDVKIGSNSFIGGEVSNWTTIGDEVTFMGRIVHSYRKPGDAESWRNSAPKPSPIIGNNCVIGENALLIGGITIGDGSYIAAGEIVKFDVPSNHLVISGKIYPLEIFKGFIKARK